MAMAQRHPEELVHVPRSAVRFPLELPVPSGFVASEPETWPVVEKGNLEYVDGKLLYMPPCGRRQRVTCIDVGKVLAVWRDLHTAFEVGGNEAGILLEGDVRGADIAVWRRDVLGPIDGRYARVAPVLAVEVKGELEEEALLREKAKWYLAHGVEVVWLLLNADARVIVIDADGETTYGLLDHIPPRKSLPDLSPAVSELFRQILEDRR